MAAASGHEAAARARDALAKRMAPDQVAKAQTRASEWLPVGSDDGKPLAFSVANTQRLLIELGYDPGSADGILKTQTRSAIRKYQDKAKLPANGRLTPAVFAALSKSAGRKVQTGKAAAAAPAPAPQPAEAAPKEDAAAKRVTDIQARLRQLGYAVPSVSGTADEATRAAIRTYEADQGMTVTGRASPEVLDRLIAQERSEAADERNLNRIVQSRLNALGYDAGPPDGAMGDRTTKAIQAFERESGLPVTGKPSAELATNLEVALGEKEKAEAEKKATKEDPAPDPKLVQTVKTELNKRGYNAGVEDGAVTEQTSIAIRAYQTDAGLDANGKVSGDLLAHLQANPEAPAAETMSPAQVTDLERELEARGYRAGTIDGRVDGDLRAAIRMYQADSGVEVTGEPSAELLAQVQAT
ncbi:MAG: peptidoglycan-binding domain-containing protein, partial [Proteobacteria bacterium]|nr:peptidoglycan-binding domain-containing protein [Pseudomonadota bacterium]